MLQSININNDIYQSTNKKKIKKSIIKLTAKSEYVIYLMECTLCNKQYFGKAETVFNVRLNNHKKDIKNPNAILACRHFQ